MKSITLEKIGLGNAATATKLQSAALINGVEWDGSQNITIYDNTKQAYSVGLSAIAGLAGTSGLLRKTGENTYALDTNTYVTSSGVTSVGGTLPISSSGGDMIQIDDGQVLWGRADKWSAEVSIVTGA